MSGIYIASKTKHGPMWQKLKAQYPINSTWIYEWEQGASASLEDLWDRCADEVAKCDAFVLYRESNFDILKGAFVELGIAMAHRKPIFAVGIEEFSVSKSKLITNVSKLGAALDLAFLECAKVQDMLAAVNMFNGDEDETRSAN